MAVGRELNALLIAAKEVSVFTVGVRNGSPSRGVVKVGDDGADVVTEAVVTIEPINVVVTIVSISGDESAVNVVYVGV